MEKAITNMQHPITGNNVLVQHAVFKIQVWQDVQECFKNYFNSNGDLKKQWAVYLKSVAATQKFTDEAFAFLGTAMKRFFEDEASYMLFADEDEATRFLNLTATFHQGLVALNGGGNG